MHISEFLHVYIADTMTRPASRQWDPQLMHQSFSIVAVKEEVDYEVLASLIQTEANIGVYR